LRRAGDELFERCVVIISRVRRIAALQAGVVLFGALRVRAGPGKGARRAERHHVRVVEHAVLVDEVRKITEFLVCGRCQVKPAVVEILALEERLAVLRADKITTRKHVLNAYQRRERSFHTSSRGSRIAERKRGGNVGAEAERQVEPKPGSDTRFLRIIAAGKIRCVVEHRHRERGLQQYRIHVVFFCDDVVHIRFEHHFEGDKQVERSRQGSRTGLGLEVDGQALHATIRILRYITELLKIRDVPLGAQTVRIPVVERFFNRFFCDKVIFCVRGERCSEFVQALERLSVGCARRREDGKIWEAGTRVRKMVVVEPSHREPGV